MEINSTKRRVIDGILGGSVPNPILRLVDDVITGRRKPAEVIEPAPPLLLNFNEAARRLGRSRSFFYKLRQAGTVPVVTVGGAEFVRSEDLDHLISGLGKSSPITNEVSA